MAFSALTGVQTGGRPATMTGVARPSNSTIFWREDAVELNGGKS
jgi:hypothetical protein